MKTKKNRESGTAEIKIKVLPRSSRNQILGKEDGVYRAKTTAPPVDGRANRAIVELLAKKLGLSKGSVEIVSGERSRLKSLRIHGLSEAEIEALLEE